jgi:hypothetical protein
VEVARGSANGIDPYSQDRDAIYRLVRLCETGLANPDIFAMAKGVPREAMENISGAAIGWAVPWVKRFPMHSFLRLDCEGTHDALLGMGRPTAGGGGIG